MTDSNPTPLLESAILGGGCFWCLEAVFLEVEGVHAVKSGYCGGHLDSPSYRQVCSGSTGHAEVVKIDFDPALFSYRDLLEIFFTIHDPTTLDRQGNDVGSQYRSAIFVTSEAQLQAARTLIKEMSGLRAFPSAIVTQVEPAPTFWPAEVEHHDYYALNGDQPYCQYVVAPKVAKFYARFGERRRRDGR